MREQRDENTGVKIDAHTASSSLILLTSAPALSRPDNVQLFSAANTSRSPGSANNPSK
jgi:hypothetical protein